MSETPPRFISEVSASTTTARPAFLSMSISVEKPPVPPPWNNISEPALFRMNQFMPIDCPLVRGIASCVLAMALAKLVWVLESFFLALSTIRPSCAFEY